MTTEHESRTRLLEATLKVVREKGYAAARVEDICAEAGLTKGSFFHHFKSKDDLAMAAAARWDEHVRTLFAAADYHRHDDPLERLLAYVRLRKELLSGALSDYTCFAGTIVQEAYATHPALSAACASAILGHASTLEADIAEATRAAGVAGDWTPASLARHMQAVVQGALILAKATGGPDAAAESLDHLARYLRLLLRVPGAPDPKED